MSLQVIGGGKMAEALLGGLVGSGVMAVADLHVVEPQEARRHLLKTQNHGLSVGTEPLPGVDAVIAVKPDVVPKVLPVLAKAEVKRVLSIAAGVRIASLEGGLAQGTVVVRAMPNTGVLVGQGAAAVAKGSAAKAADLDWAVNILAAVGAALVVDEVALDAVTGLSGSGPAYVFLLAEALAAAGVKQGLTPEVADLLTRQTLLGAATLLKESSAEPAQLRANVTSAGGTTEAGVAVLQDADFSGLVAAAVRAATIRSRELGC